MGSRSHHLLILYTLLLSDYLLDSWVHELNLERVETEDRIRQEWVLLGQSLPIDWGVVEFAKVVALDHFSAD
jgi:hypothetical protein